MFRSALLGLCIIGIGCSSSSDGGGDAPAPDTATDSAPSTVFDGDSTLVDAGDSMLVDASDSTLVDAGDSTLVDASDSTLVDAGDSTLVDAEDTSVADGSTDFGIAPSDAGDASLDSSETGGTTDLCPSCGPGERLCKSACVSNTNPDYGCGACSPCYPSVPHTTWACAAGACSVGTCEPGWADCDGMASNGCETDLSSAAHCGSCTNSCGTAKCRAGTCVTACTPPETDCSGACVNLTTSPSHCGGCARACATGPRETASCAAGTCSGACAAGSTACGGKCVDTNTDPNNCGACGTVCSGSTGLVKCSSGTCTATCPAGTTACSGECVDTTSDRLNCGSCATTCAGTCEASTCKPALSLILTTGTNPTALETDGANVYWIDSGTSSVNRTSTTATPVTVALATGQASPYDLAIDATHVYWTNMLGGAVMRVNKSGGTPEVVSAATEPQNLEVDSDWVYWHDSVGVRRALKSGGSAVVIAADGKDVTGLIPSCVLDIAVDAANVYMRVNKSGACTAAYGIWSRALDGAGPTSLVHATPCFQAPPFGLSATAVWLTERDPSTCVYDSAILHKYSKTGADLGMPAPIYASSYSSTAKYFYAAGRPYMSLAGWGIYQFPECGGRPRIVHSDSAKSYGRPVAGDNYVYWIYGGKIYRAPI